MRPYGDVVECRGDVDFKARPGAGRATCHEKSTAQEFKLVVGTEDRHRMVSILRRGSGSEFSIVLSTRGRVSERVGALSRSRRHGTSALHTCRPACRRRLCAAGGSARPAPLAITHVTVVDTTVGAVTADMTVLIQDDRIIAVGRSPTIPRGAEIIDGRNTFLIPWALGHARPPFLRARERTARAFVANGVTGCATRAGSGRLDRWRAQIAE